SLCITNGPPLVERLAPPTMRESTRSPGRGQANPSEARLRRPDDGRGPQARKTSRRSHCCRIYRPQIHDLGPTIGLSGISLYCLPVANCAPGVFVHTRGHVFVVRMRDVFAYRLRVLEAGTANAAMPLVAGENVRTPLGAFWVVFGIGHFQIL